MGLEVEFGSRRSEMYEEEELCSALYVTSNVLRSILNSMGSQ